MTGFRSQVETETVGAFSGIGKKVAATVGIALGASAAYHVVKDAVNAASSVQKSTEVIAAEYGKAGRAVVDFAEKQGVALGSLKEDTLSTAGNLGILYKNLNFSHDASAKMTQGWEKLVLAFNAAKGGGVAGAASQLDRLRVVASGAATRSLRQLGISIDSATQQAQAFKDGMISTIHQALTPSQKALVTYQLAMQHMPALLALAQKHSHDLANQTAKLKAEWGSGEAVLGKALIPTVNKGVTALTNWLGRMQRTGALQRDFNGVITVTTSVVKSAYSAMRLGVAIWDKFANVVGGSANLVKIFLGVLAVSKIAAISGSVKGLAHSFTGPLRSGIRQAGAEATSFSTKVKLGVFQAAAFNERAAARMKAGWTRFARQGEAEMSGLAAATKADAAEMQSSLVSYYKKQEAAAVKAFASTEELTAAWATATKAETVSTTGAFTGMWTRVKAGAVAAFTTVEGVSLAALTTIKAAFLSLFAVAWPLLIGTAVAYVITHWEKVKRYTLALVHASVAAFRGLKDIIVGVYQYIYGKAFYYLIGPIKDFIDVLAKAAGWIPFLGDKIKGAAAAVDQFTSSVHHFAESGRKSILQGAHTLGRDVTKAWSDSLKGAATNPTAKKNARDSGSQSAKDFTQGFKQTLAQTGPAVTQTLNDTLANAIRAAHQKIQETISAAKSNLDKIGSDLAKTIDKIQQKIGGAVGAVAGSPQGKAFEKLKKLIESGAPAFEIQKAQAELGSQLQNVGKTQQSVVQNQLADLTAALNTGKISYKQFHDRLHEILRKDGITLAQAMKAGGAAFRDTFRAQVAALQKQAAAIAALPAKYRHIGGAGDNIKIIRPLETIRQEAQKVAVAAAHQRAEQIKQAAAIAKATQKTAQYTQQMASHGIKVSGPPPGTAPLNITKFVGPRPGPKVGTGSTPPKLAAPPPVRPSAPATRSGTGSPVPRFGAPPRPAAPPPRRPAVSGGHPVVTAIQAGVVHLLVPLHGIRSDLGRWVNASSRYSAEQHRLLGRIRDLLARPQRTAEGRLQPPLDAIRTRLIALHSQIARLIVIQAGWRSASLGREGGMTTALVRLALTLGHESARLLQSVAQARLEALRSAVNASKERQNQARISQAQLLATQSVHAAILALRRQSPPQVHVTERAPQVRVTVPPHRPPTHHSLSLAAFSGPLRGVREAVVSSGHNICADLARLNGSLLTVRQAILGQRATRQPGGNVAAAIGRLSDILHRSQTEEQRIVAAVVAERAGTMRALTHISTEVAGAERDIVAAVRQTSTPMEELRRSEARIADRAARQRETMIREGRTTNTILRRLARSHGPSPGFNKEPKGHGSHQARRNHRIGVKA